VTKVEAIQIVAMLNAAFGHSRLTAQGCDIYVDMVQDLGFSPAKEAVRRLLSKARFMPTIAEIRETAADVTLGPARSGEEAYAILLRAIAACGWCSPPKFRDPHITRALGVWGSWVDVCASPADDAAGRARFIELYEQSAKRERADVVAGKPLPAPRAGLREFGPQTPPAARKRAPEPEPSGAAAMVVVPAAPRQRQESPIAGKRLSAADIDAALEGP